MADDFARQLLDALYNPETQPPQQPSRPLREKLAGAAETAATLGSGLLASVPAGLAGLTQLIPTRGHRPSVNRAAEKVEEVQSALTRLPRTEAGQEYLGNTVGALGVLGMPAEFLGEQTLKLTGSPFLATVANVGLDPVNYIGMPGSGRAIAAGTKAAGRTIVAAPRVAGEMISDLVMPAPRAQAQRGAIDLGPQIPEFQPQTSLGLVSRADEALAALPRNKGTGAEFLRELEKTPGVRMAELEDRGLVEALSGMGKVTKADVIKALQDNPPVQLKEVMLGSESLTPRQKLTIEYDRAREESGRVGGSTNPSYIERIPESNRTPEEQRLLEAWNRVDQSLEESWLSENPPTKYGQYALPGGENYREILLTLPVKKPSEKDVRLEPRTANFGGSGEGFNAYIGDAFIGSGRTQDEALANALRNAPDDILQNYRSGHWNEPNVLAHARISDRTGPNGEKILHVEEVQSDWHQTGRKSGYKTGKEQQQLDEAKWQYSFNKGMQQDFYRFAEGLPEGDPQRLKYLQQANDLTPKLMKLDSEISRIRQAMEEGVPDAPFKKNWHELMMRRLVDYAAKNGYDRIAITPGAEQASRYDLSKRVDEINVVGRVNALTGEKTKSVALDMKSGESFRLGVSADGTVDNVNNDSIKNFVGKKLSDVIGKDLSSKILSEDVKTLSGVDLQVGGEGMKGFYDKILPTYLNELGKPYGVKVGQTDVITKKESRGVNIMTPDEPEIYPAQTMKVHSFDITPQMREAIKSKGLPLYAKGGSVHISDNPDTMALELAGGGAVAAAKAAAKAAEKAAAKAKPVYPQAEALERARQNAVKMLNLPENNTPEMRAQAMGYIDYLHGTQRLDRLLEGKTLDPRRATSGPMPYGTTTPELASSYATSKADTSRRATDEGDVRRYFEVAPKDIGIQGLRSPLPVETAWHFMTPEQQAKIRELAPRVGYENLDEFTGKLMVHPEGVNGNLSANHWNWLMKNEAKGNPLTALRHMWYESGQLVHEPETLGQIYRLAGVDAPISQTKAPWTESQGVLLGKARITNPIDTSNTEQVSALIEPLKQAFARDRSRTKAVGPDQWAKDVRYTPRSWVSELEKDLAEGKESYVWTSIPDKVTAELRRLGFNGIIDRSGKGGGSKEPVVIPFDPAQVRSRFAAFDPAEMDVPDLLKATGGIIKAATKAVKPTAEQAATMAAQKAEMALRSRAMQELKDQFENLPQPPKGFLSSESILQRMDEIRRREATPSGEQIPLLKKGGAIEMQAGGALKAAAKAAEKAAAQTAFRQAAEQTVKSIYPQADALERARQNAVKMLGLPENNTAMDRARAMGFVHDQLFHGTVNDFPAFKVSDRSSVYATDSPAIADIYANATGRHKGLREVNASPNVMPLMYRGKLLEVSDQGKTGGGWLGDNLAAALGTEWRRNLVKEVPSKGYSGIKVKDMDDLGGRQSQYIFPDPIVLRSRFAAFDPAEMDKPGLLKKNGGAAHKPAKKVAITDNLDTMRLAVQKRK